MNTPWLTEPDSENIDAGDLYPRFIRRMPGAGHLCGYIAIPPEHPWHSLGYDDIECSVHGGLTYARASEDFDDAAPRGWSVFGFDCAHAGDLVPLRQHVPLPCYGEYRTIQYVREQLLELAKQAKAQSKP